MNRPALSALALMFSVGAHGASAQDLAKNSSALVRVRYMVSDVPAAAGFYTSKLGFKVDLSAGGYFAALSRGGLQLLLSPTKGPGGASQPMPNGERPAPGGWTRIVLNVADLQGEVTRLRKEGVHFRNDITTGPGGKEILLEDPSGNPVELFQPG
ncbi:VOC family protein [Phenylobacterium sp.]|jgi:catechol 2,3-dioxygenase-like lactoylglutathione lyase family enzyme|uniref:VOC family protein n=1 Tax=Phenylobacterium sp. TaxID=1871053 RepID=UPI002F408F9C